MMVQPGGTTATLPTMLNAWQEYLRLYASIKILNKRGQSVADLKDSLAKAEARIMSALSVRKEEPTQPPLLRGVHDFDCWGFE
jgi:hypothetical protein